MYGAAMCYDGIPVSYEIIRRKETGFLPEYGCKKYEHYENAERILAFYKWDLDLQNFHSYRQRGERICATEKFKFRPDGVGEYWSNGTFQCNVLLEIWGDKTHLCSIHRENPSKYHPIRRKKDGSRMTYEEVGEFDNWRLSCLQREWPDAKIIVVEMCSFAKDYETETGPYSSRYKQFILENPQFKRDNQKKTEYDILQDILHERITGFVVADFEVGEELRGKTELFPLFFQKNYGFTG